MCPLYQGLKSKVLRTRSSHKFLLINRWDDDLNGATNARGLSILYTMNRPRTRFSSL